MDFQEIITYALSALGGGGVVGIANWRINKRKAKAEVKADEIENLKNTIESIYQPIIDDLENLKNTIESIYQPIIDDLKRRVAEVEGEVRDVRAENEVLRKENAKLRAELAELRNRAMFRNTERGTDGKFKKKDK